MNHSFSEEQLDMLRHMLGINTPEARSPQVSRNYAAVTPGDPLLCGLAAIGAVERYREAAPPFPYDYYRCTDLGVAAALRSFRSIRLPKAKRVYCQYLSVADVVAGLTFHQFLTLPAYREMRAAA